MKKILAIALLALVVTGASAQEEKKEKDNKPVFTVVKELPITSIKDQNRSGTCWNYSTLSYFEAEILKKSGKTYDLCEAFVANKTYMDRAIQVVRLHGDCQFSQGGAAYDVLYALQNYGICPDDAMPFPGSLQGDSLFNFNEFFSLLEPYVNAVAKNKASKISQQWKVGLQGILDAYLGKCPETFTYEGKTYTPQSFAKSLGLDWNDYVSITSYTHRPFYTAFPVEVQDNWRNPLSYNLPMDEMMRVIDNAIATDSTNAIFLFAKSSALLNAGQYEQCVDITERLLAADDSMPEAYCNMGLAYYNQAVELERSMKRSRKKKEAVNQLYEKSRPYMEKFREMAPEHKEKWVPALYAIYLNLNKGKEFEEIDRIRGTITEKKTVE